MQTQAPIQAPQLRPDQIPEIVMSLGWRGNYRYLTTVRLYPDSQARQILAYHGVTEDLEDPEVPEPREYGRVGAMPTAHEITIAKYYWDNWRKELRHSTYFWAVKEELGITEQALRNALKNTNMQPRHVAERQKQAKLRELIALADKHPEWNMATLGKAVGIERSTATSWLRKARRGY